METLDNFGIRNRVFFYGIFLALIVLSIMVLKPFTSVLAFSIISVFMLNPLYKYLLKFRWVRGRQRLAASLSLLIFLLLLVIPILFLSYLTISQLSGFLDDFSDYDISQLAAQAEGILTQIFSTLDPGELAIRMQELAKEAASVLADVALSIIASLPALMMQGIVFVVVVITLLPEYDRLVDRLKAISPLGIELSDLYYRKTTAMVSSMVTGVFLVAIIQGLVMGVFFWLAGVPYTFLLTLLSMVAAMLPIVGISYIALIVAFFLALSGDIWGAVIVLFGFYGVVNWIDVFLRPRLISKEAYMNFALVLLGILGGVIWAGMLGLIFGPVIILLLVTTIDIYAEQFSQEDGHILKSIFSSDNPETVNGDQDHSDDNPEPDSIVQ